MNLGVAGSTACRDRVERHAVSGADERERRCRRGREPVRQERKELLETVASGGAESRRQVRNRPPGHVSGQPVQDRVAGAPRSRRLRPRLSGGNHEVIVAKAPYDLDSVIGRMLPVAVQNENIRRGSATDAALYGGAVSFVVRMTNDPCAGAARRLPCSIARSIVDDDDFLPGGAGAERRHDRANRCRFIECGNDDGYR